MADSLCIIRQFVLVYEELDCTVDAITGSGDVIVQHDFTGNVTGQSGHQSVQVAYLGLSTSDELQSVIDMSETCRPDIIVTTVSCMENLIWTSLNGDTWKMIDACTR